MAYGTLLTALSDPTRRKIFEHLGHGDRTVGDVARLSRITQPAASQHLRILRKAHLVTVRRDGTRRYYRADRKGLAELRRYIESLWDDVLAAYANGGNENRKGNSK